MEKEIPLQDFYIDAVDMTQPPVRVLFARNQIRYDCQRDWQLLWEKDFIYAGCNGGIGSDINRLENIIKVAEARLKTYREIAANKD
jgi:hypothetical protein